MRLYSYIVATDDGFAPCAQGSVCSLAICKPVIRRVAQFGNWIMGTTPKKRGAGRLTYLMQVEGACTFREYFENRSLRGRRDNIYRPLHSGSYTQLKNPAHTIGNMPKDLSADRVLISRRFAYFGMGAPVIPQQFSRFIAKGQGHRVFGNRHGEAPDAERDKQIAALVKWAFKQSRVQSRPPQVQHCAGNCN